MVTYGSNLVGALKSQSAWIYLCKGDGPKSRRDQANPAAAPPWTMRTISRFRLKKRNRSACRMGANSRLGISRRNSPLSNKFKKYFALNTKWVLGRDPSSQGHCRRFGSAEDRSLTIKRIFPKKVLSPRHSKGPNQFRICSALLLFLPLDPPRLDPPIDRYLPAPPHSQSSAWNIIGYARPRADICAVSHVYRGHQG